MHQEAGQWRGGLLRLLDLLLPAVCALCGGPGAGASAVCQPCQARYLRARTRCPRCANPLGGAGREIECGACLARRPAFDATVAATDYSAPLDQLALQLKFGGVLALAPFCAAAIAAAHSPQAALPDVLCPVPLGPLRLAERGFNQALEIARPLAQRLQLPLAARLCVRVHDTRAQSTLAPGERRANIRHAFALAPGAEALVRGRHIGVVDDIMSSGHTLGEIASTLKRHGAARVSNFVFARTPPR